MCPSLQELFDQLPDKDENLDLEDMSHRRLQLKPDFRVGVWFLGGSHVVIGIVNEDEKHHHVKIVDGPNQGVEFTFDNDLDVYA